MRDPALSSEHQDIRVEAPNRGGLMMLAKRMVQGLFTLWILPRQCVMMLMRPLVGRDAFRYAGESIARVPGLRGVYQRQAFYRWNLRKCGRDVYFGWNSTFSMPEAEVGDRVYIGKFCGVGFAKIGEEVMLADHVQILSGGREHNRAESDETMHEQAQTFRQVTIGRGAWIGTGAIIMADVGEGSIVGAGAVVNKAVPAHCVVVGVPARVVKHLPEGGAELAEEQEGANRRATRASGMTSN